MRKVLLLGASGNIGTQSLDIFEADRASFELVGISVGKQTDKVEPILERFPSIKGVYCIDEGFAGDFHQDRNMSSEPQVHSFAVAQSR